MGRFDGVVICSDVDGTLALGKTIPDRNRKAIEAFQAEGGRFTLATGRMAGYHEVLSLRLNAPAISHNGACISDPESGRVYWTFPLDGCGLLLEWLDTSSCPAVNLVFADESVLTVPGSVADSFLNHGSSDLLKIVCSFPDEASALCFRDAARKTFADRYQVHRSWDTGVEFLSPLAGKGACLRFLREICEDVHTVVAVGDFENDLSMLRMADLSFAPSNACDEVLLAADRVVCSCKDGAIADVIACLDSRID